MLVSVFTVLVPVVVIGYLGECCRPLIYVNPARISTSVSTTRSIVKGCPYHEVIPIVPVLIPYRRYLYPEIYRSFNNTNCWIASNYPTAGARIDIYFG